MLPTLVELAGARIPPERDGLDLPPVEGESFVATFAGGDWRRQRSLWFEHEGNRALRDGSWKLVSRFPDAWELYQIEDDRTELHDLADREPARLRRMIDAWDERAADVRVRNDIDWVWEQVRSLHDLGASKLHSLFRTIRS